jgi:LmbE family N-acetylglucosaminyl deacetylase
MGITRMNRGPFRRWRTTLLNWLLPRRTFKFFLRDWDPLSDLDRVADAMGSLRQSGRLRPLVVTGPMGRRIAIVAPHPDDESIGAGGTLLGARAAGASIDALFLTDDPNPELAAVRRAEAAAACGTLGATAHFLGHLERAIPVDMPALTAFGAALDSFSGGAGPDTLFVPFLADDHDDHRRANELLLRAVDGGHLRARPEIWAYQVYTSMPCNVFVDIGVHVAGKSEAIRRHASQIARRDWVSTTLGLNAYNARFASGGPAGGLYEGFFVLPFDEYLDLCRRYFRDSQTACYRSPSYRSGMDAH